MFFPQSQPMATGRPRWWSSQIDPHPACWRHRRASPCASLVPAKVGNITYVCMYLYSSVWYTPSIDMLYIYTYMHAYITLHYIALHCIALHCITFHYITLHTYIHYINTRVYIYIYIHVCIYARTSTCVRTYVLMYCIVLYCRVLYYYGCMSANNGW